MEKNQNRLQYLLLGLRKHSRMRRAILLLLPLTILCFILHHYHFFYHSFFNQLQSIKNFINKKALFGIFNAILLFLAKDSGLLASSGGQPAVDSRHGTEFVDRRDEGRPPSTPKGAFVESEQVEMEVVGSSDVAVAEEGVGGDEIVIFREMEELGVDELNRKCEEFIQRVKNERKMEALQLALV